MAGLAAPLAKQQVLRFAQDDNSKKRRGRASPAGRRGRLPLRGARWIGPRRIGLRVGLVGVGLSGREAVGSNDIALRPSCGTVFNMAQLAWLTPRAFIDRGLSLSLGHFRAIFDFVFTS